MDIFTSSKNWGKTYTPLSSFLISEILVCQLKNFSISRVREGLLIHWNIHFEDI